MPLLLSVPGGRSRRINQVVSLVDLVPTLLELAGFQPPEMPAIDGISLTIAELDETEAVFWITPHTWENTHLHAVQIGQAVNLEADMLAKHVEKLISARVPEA